MMANTADLLKLKGATVFSVSSDTSIRDALLLMENKDVGALLILDGDVISGIFSERDFARLIARKGVYPLDTSVRDVMTKEVHTITPATCIEDCMQLMTEKHIRHLPVLDSGKLVGLISIGDVVKAIITSQRDLIDQLEGYISGRW